MLILRDVTDTLAQEESTKFNAVFLLNKKALLTVIISVVVTAVLMYPAGYRTRVLAEQSGTTPESGVTSYIKQIYDSLVTLTYGSDGAGAWGNWGAMWNRIRSAAEWTPGGSATADEVVSGETFYTASRTGQTGTLALSGDAGAGDVMSGKTFYGDSLTKLTGTWSFLGDATASDVLSGKTFYANSLTLLTGTAPAPIDFTNQQYSARDDKGGPDGSGAEDYQGEESVWTSPATNVWQDTRTGVYWSSDQGNMSNSFTAISLNTCDFFNTFPRKGYAGGDPDCGAAINYCATLDFGGRTDWYLPSEKELQQASIDGMYNQAGDTLTAAAAFTTENLFWSSSEVSYVSNGSYAWFVYLFSGDVSLDYKTSAGYAVRCVSRD